MRKGFFAFALAAAACMYTRGIAAAEPSTIGAMSELTGNFARFGEDCRRGYEIAQAHSASKARVLYGDHQSDPKIGIAEFHRFVDAEHASLLVSSRSPVVLALNPISVQQKIPLIGVIGHPRFVAENPLAVRVFPSAAVEATVLADYVRSRNETRLATISTEDEYFLGLRSELETRMGKDAIVFSETVAPSEQDFASLLLRIKSKTPTAILANVAPAQMVQLVNKISQSGLKVQVYANFVAGNDDIRKALGPNAEGIVFAELDYQKPEFLKAVSEKAASTPLSPLGYSCYVALTYAFELERMMQSKDVSPQQAIASLNKVLTLDGPVSFSNREADFEVVPKMVRQGAVVPAVQNSKT